MTNGKITIEGNDDFRIRKALDFLKEIVKDKTLNDNSTEQAKSFILELETHLNKYIIIRPKFMFLLEKATQKNLVELQKEEIK